MEPAPQVIASSDAARNATAAREHQIAEEALDDTFLRPLPLLLVVAGAVSAIVAPRILEGIPGATGTGLLAAKVSLGLLVVALGAWIYWAKPSAAFTYPAVTLVAIAYAVTDMANVRLGNQAQFNSQPWLLLGAGFLILRTRWLHPIMVTMAVGAWWLFAGRLDNPAIQQYCFQIAVGITLGYLLHFIRVRSVRRMALGVAAESESREALHQALHDARQSEVRLRALTESSPLGIFETDAHGMVVYANRRWCEIAGCDYRDLAAIRRAVHPDDVGELTQNWRAALAAGTELAAEFRYVHADGTVRNVATRAVPLRDTAGVLTGFTGTLEDETMRKQTAEADRIAFGRLLEIEQLKEMDRFKTRILSTASHELNTPITPLKLQLRLLRNGAFGGLNKQQAASVAMLERNTNRLASLVAEVLDVARLQGGHLKLAPVPLDVRHVVQEEAEAFVAPANAAGVALEVDCTGDLHAVADPQRIGQVLVNLISNALKFTPKGGTIAVRAKRTNGEVEVRVSDTGLGLEPHQIMRLFQPFSQVHDPARIQRPGTGLGLYISKGIVTEHGGAMDVSSPGPGKGSTFWFRLPISGPPPVAPQGAGLA